MAIAGPSASRIASSSQTGSRSSEKPAKTPFAAARAITRVAAPATSIRPLPTALIGSSSRGKKTLPTRAALATSACEPRCRTPENKVQVSMPVRAMRKYGTGPLGSRATRPKTKVNTAAEMSGCRSTQNTPRAVCR